MPQMSVYAIGYKYIFSIDYRRIVLPSLIGKAGIATQQKLLDEGAVHVSTAFMIPWTVNKHRW